MKVPNYKVTLYVEVHDEEELYAAALKYATENDGLSPEIAKEHLNPGGERDLGICVYTLLDPGSIAGGNIIDSEVETLGWSDTETGDWTHAPEEEADDEG